MKKHLFLLAVLMVFGLALTSCAVERSSDIYDDGTKPKGEITQAQASGTTRLPTWAEGLVLKENEVYTHSTRADWPHYNSITALAAAATRYIVNVEVLDKRVELFNNSLGDVENYDINTIYRLKVLDVFYGDTQPGEIIEVRQIGGQLGNLTVENRDFVSLVVGDKLVMFLGGISPEELGVTHRPAYLINPTQALYRAAPMKGDLIAQEANVTLASVDPDNDLVLTMDDLAQIAQENR